MMVLCINGSPRKDGNTNALIGEAVKVLNEKGIETEVLQISDHSMSGCTACMTCFETRKCVIDDDLAKIYDKMVKADGLIVGSPTYFGCATPEIMALLQRAGYVSFAQGRKFERKVGAPLAVARRAGKNFTNLQLLQWYLINGFIIPGSHYWNVGIAGPRGARDMEKDEEGIKNIRHFAGEVAWLLGMIK